MKPRPIKNADIKRAERPIKITRSHISKLNAEISKSISQNELKRAKGLEIAEKVKMK